MIMKRIIVIVLIIIVTLIFVSCISSDLSKSRQFILDQDTPVAVNVYNDWENVAIKIENELIKKGVNVVPIEQARRKVEVDYYEEENDGKKVVKSEGSVV